jgi:hypothetical protein
MYACTREHTNGSIKYLNSTVSTPARSTIVTNSTEAQRTGQASEALGRQRREEDVLEEAGQADLVLHAQPLSPLPDIHHEAFFFGWGVRGEMGSIG